MTEPGELVALCERGVERARRLGADQVEVYAEALHRTEVELQKDDMHTASTAEETSFGIRVVKSGSLGFATVNGTDHLDHACRDALAMAAAAPPDPLNGLREPESVVPLDEARDPGVASLDIAELVELAAGMLRRVKEIDERVRVDAGGVGATARTRAIATSTGIGLCEERASAGAYLFGMAVDGEDVGSFDTERAAVLKAAELEPEIRSSADRFVEKCVGALGAQKGESFRGTVILSPEVVAEFVLGNLLAILTGKAVRTGKCPLAARVGKAVASNSITLIEDGRLVGGTASGAFDREGTPTRRTPILREGVLEGFLYDVYEARAAGKAPTGHARGNAAAQPGTGASNLLLLPGGTSTDTLCSEPGRAILVNRLSGSSNPVTGDFSGVVKGGFLLKRGERLPIRETLIAGNLYQLLHSVSGVSKEVRNLQGRAWVPALRAEEISVTAG